MPAAEAVPGLTAVGCVALAAPTGALENLVQQLSEDAGARRGSRGTQCGQWCGASFTPL